MTQLTHFWAVIQGLLISGWTGAEQYLASVGVQTPLFDLVIGGVIGGALLGTALKLGNLLRRKIEYKPQGFFSRVHLLSKNTKSAEEFFSYLPIPAVLDTVHAVFKVLFSFGLRQDQFSDMALPERTLSLHKQLATHRKFSNFEIDGIRQRLDEVDESAHDRIEEVREELLSYISPSEAEDDDQGDICVPGDEDHGCYPPQEDSPMPSKLGQHISEYSLLYKEPGTDNLRLTTEPVYTVSASIPGDAPGPVSDYLENGTKIVPVQAKENYEFPSHRFFPPEKYFMVDGRTVQKVVHVMAGSGQAISMTSTLINTPTVNHGPYVEWHSNGLVKVEGSYRANGDGYCKVGQWNYYDRAGKLIAEHMFGPDGRSLSAQSHD